MSEEDMQQVAIKRSQGHPADPQVDLIVQKWAISRRNAVRLIERGFLETPEDVRGVRYGIKERADG